MFSCCVTGSFLLPFMSQAHPTWVSPALTLDFRAPGSWGTGIQPLLPPSPPCPSPGRGTPAWPGFPTASPGDVSGPHLGLLGSLEVETGSDRAAGKGGWGPACWGHSVTPHLGASCSSWATFPFCRHWPFCILISGPSDSALQPHRDPFLLPWTLGPSSPHLVSGRLHGSTSVPFPEPRC